MSMKADFDIDAYLANPIFQKPALMLLMEARQLLMDPDQWTKGTCHRIEEQVNKFCIQGALAEIGGKTSYESDLKQGFDLLGNRYSQKDHDKATKLMHLVCQGEAPSFQGFNDRRETEHSEIITKFSTAIAVGIEMVQSGTWKD